MDILFEIILDVVFELYTDLLSYFMPDKTLSKRTRVLLKVLCAVVSIINVSLLFVGVWLIKNSSSVLGIILTAFSSILILIHLIFAIIINVKNR